MKIDLLNEFSFPENPIFPLWLKIAYSIFVAILVPVYIKKWGWGNFLWFSDQTLFITLAALWFESGLLISMISAGILLPEIAWNIDYFGRLLTGRQLFGLSDYMFEKDKSLFVRGLSLFHVILPPIMIWMMAELGYQENAVFYMVGFAWIILLLTYFLTDPNENINWVFGPGVKPQNKIPSWKYLLIVMIAFPVLVFIPTHFLLLWIFG